MLAGFVVFFGIAGLGVLVGIFLQAGRHHVQQLESEERRHGETLAIQERIHRETIACAPMTEHALVMAVAMHLAQVHKDRPTHRATSWRPPPTPPPADEKAPVSGYPASDVVRCANGGQERQQ